MKKFNKIALVGYTGFVGSNIYSAGKINYAYNSRNIADAFGTNPDLLIYAGLRAEKYLANNAPELDLKQIRQAEDNISRIGAEKLVLISTIDVFKRPADVDETAEIDTNGLHAYGYNRYLLEEWVRNHYPDALIIRLPGLYGKNLKKNFIYDIINVIPFMLKEEKFRELNAEEPELAEYYELQDNGFYRATVEDCDKPKVRAIFKRLGFSALNFTDSRSVYQFYNLSRLWQDIQIAVNSDIRLLHTATEPVSAGELYRYLTGDTFVNELTGNPAYYNYKTIHDDLFNGNNGYLDNKEAVLKSLKTYVHNEQSNQKR